MQDSTTKHSNHQILTGNCRIGGILGFNTTEIKQQARIQTALETTIQEKLQVKLSKSKLREQILKF